MKASVSLITYNQAPYICQAIESVLAQKTDFEFELVIGEDDSSDGTRQIVEEYRSRYPDKIRLFLHSRADVIHINGRPTGRRNFVHNLRNARGRYVALLDGDDYWTSPFKLQKQVDFLEQNAGCALCFHNVEVRDESEPKRRELHHSKPMRARYEIADLLKGNFMHTCSVVYRAGLFPDFPGWFFECPVGDWPLHVLNAQHGWIGYLDEVMGVYRKHGRGVWSGQARLKILADSIQTAECIRVGLSPVDRRSLDAGMAEWYREMIELHGAGGDSAAACELARVYFGKFLFRTKTRPLKVLKAVLGAGFRGSKAPLT